MSLKSPISWQQKADRKAAYTRLCRARHSMASAVVALSALLLVSDPVLKVAGRVYSGFVEHQQALYRAQRERAHLLELNSRIKTELVSLRSNHARNAQLELHVSSKLDALESVVEETLGLGILRPRARTKGAPQQATKVAKTPTDNKLAAILNSPQLAPQPSGSLEASFENQPRERALAGVGGAEDPCDDTLCEFGVSKEDVALHNSMQGPADSGRKEESSAVTSSALEQRLDKAISVMRILPIGAPVHGEITSHFGRRHSPFSRRISFHHGIDVSLRVGSRVMSTGAGVIKRVAYNRTYGTLIDVEHFKGLVTRYAHLAKALVRPGQRVTRGQLIALSGSTGRSTGPHLHYEVIHNGKPRNPAPFIQLADRLANVAPFSLKG
jgi:murein DD-endopeptidase MepM/ murein hydrolase activator NlpD